MEEKQSWKPSDPLSWEKPSFSLRSKLWQIQVLRKEAESRKVPSLCGLQWQLVNAKYVFKLHEKWCVGRMSQCEKCAFLTFQCWPSAPSFISWASVPSQDQPPSIFSDKIQNKALGEYLNSCLNAIIPNCAWKAWLCMAFWRKMSQWVDEELARNWYKQITAHPHNLHKSKAVVTEVLESTVLGFFRLKLLT